ncbi:MAG: SagB/ThcOx family dehydrogenase [Myxococcota bacterium]|nr:SagB/ThcOx family dehydrogenase [Deltaproteobacteria bacterium]MDQ3335022.1 SagB/ThcOx family dehydrogenase [Myxococcota bacterium]
MTDELDETTFPAWRDAVAAHESVDVQPRSYPGYPRVALPAHKPRRFAMSLERALAQRRSASTLDTALPDDATLGRILALAHGITADHARGPTPSAGGLQSIELFLAAWSPGWLPAGWYHYDRAGHVLARIVDGASRDACAAVIPALVPLTGGALAWIVIGDHERVRARYTTRADRFLLLEAGHLMQNLCLASVACDVRTVPLGGFYERALARTLQLPRTDRVLVAGVLG